MLTSQPIKEGAAKKLGLVDDVVPKEKLLPAARQLALAIAAGKAPRSQTLYRTDKLESLGEALAIIDFAKAQAAKKGAHLTHPQLCLDAIRWGVEFGGLKGIDKVRPCVNRRHVAYSYSPLDWTHIVSAVAFSLCVQHSFQSACMPAQRLLFVHFASVLL